MKNITKTIILAVAVAALAALLLAGCREGDDSSAKLRVAVCRDEGVMGMNCCAVVMVCSLGSMEARAVSVLRCQALPKSSRKT